MLRHSITILMVMRVRCKECKRNIDRQDALHRGLSYFCSEECFRSYRYATKAKPRKVDNPSLELRDLVLKRDRYQCSLCPSKTNLHLHHVKYRSEGGPHTSGNLLTLCNSCHGKVHSDKKHYQPLCLEIISKREQ